MDKKFKKIMQPILILVIIAVLGYYFYNRNTATPQTTSNNTYIMQVAKKSDINVTVSCTGSVFPYITKDIVSNNSGIINDLSLIVGNYVKADQKLFTVESSQVRQQVNSSLINLEKLKSQLDKLKTDEDIYLQNLQINDARNAYNNAIKQVNDMNVISPINGLITVKNNNNGDNVNSGKVILSMIDPASLKIKAVIDELDISKVKNGQKASIKFNALGTKLFTGAVESISTVGASTNNVTTYEIIINLDDKTGVLSGMTANITLLVDSKSNTISIPAEALVERGNRKFVMIPSENTVSSQNLGNSGFMTTPAPNQTNGYYYASRSSSTQTTTKSGLRATTNSPGQLVEVQTGIQNENLIEITQGITEGQRVMVLLPQSSTANTGQKTGAAGVGGMGGLGGGGNIPSAGGSRTSTGRQGG